MRNQEFWQALLGLDLSPEKSRELLAGLGTSCISAEDLAASPVLSKRDRSALQEKMPLSDEQKALLKAVSIEDADYPENLRMTGNPPVALMFRGALTTADDLAVAIVGTRKASVYARAVARKMAMEFAKGGITVVSGAAHGVDAEAHKGAMEAGGRTIAVLGSGLDRAYPASHRALLNKVAESGAVVSQFALGTKPDWWRFPARNYVIAGLARAVVVVEAPESSGSLLTANVAVEEGRHVFVTPGPIDSIAHRGSFRLINDGATLLYTPDQVFDALGVRRPRETAQPQTTLSSQQRRILETLTKQPELVDNLSDRLGQPAGVILAELTRLELEGLVAKSAGGYVRL